MLDPDLTNILRRRIGASLIDLGIVGLVTTAVWRTQLIAFPITSTDAITGDPIFDPAQIARRDEIAARLNTSFRWGNTEYALDQSGFVLTGLCALVMLALVFILVPANTGWSPGKKLLGLGVVDAKGRNPSLADYAKRSVVGLADLLPVVIPGLLGWVIANADEHRQRLGDRVAKTYVIDNRAGPKFIDPTLYERRRELRRNSLANGTPADDGMVEIGDRLGGSPSGLHRDDNDRPVAPLPDEELPAGPEPQPVDHAEPSSADLPPLTPVGSHANSLDLESLPPPEVDRTEPDRPAPSETPTPSHRFAVDASAPTNELGFVDSDRPDLGLGGPEPIYQPEPARIDAPDPVHANEMALPGTIDRAPAVRAEPGSETASAPQPTHRGTAPAEPEWEQPVPEEAPVWEPNKEPIVVAPVQHDSPVEQAGPAHETSSAKPAGETSSAAPGLVWNDQWQAWLFWDPKHEYWLRHDIENDRWIPIT